MHQVGLARHFIPTSGRMKKVLQQLLPLLQMISALFMAYKGLSIVTNTQFPVHVVISESMEPVFQRGDIVFVSNRTNKIEVGEISVVWFPGAALPMVHRVIKNTWVAREGSPSHEVE